MTTELDHLRHFRAQDAVGDDGAREAARAALAAHIVASRSPRRARRPRRRWLRAAPVLAAMLVPLAVVGPALVLLGRGHGPASGSRPSGGGIGALIAHTPQRQLQRELGYVFAATRSVENSKACRLQQPSGVTYIPGSPGRDLLSILGVLRRPATPEDRFNVRAVGSIPDVYRGYIRRAFSAGGVSYYIVPSRFDRAASIPTDRCLDLQSAAFDRYLPRIPVSLRQPTREIQVALIAYWRTSASQAPRDTICLVSVAGNGSGSSCGTGTGPKGIEAGFATENSLGTPLQTFGGVVPDGVASVTLIFPAPAHAVTTRVEGNVYAIHVNQSPAYAYSHPPTVIWRSSEGRVLKSRSTSDAANRAFICKQSPIGCLLVQAIVEGNGNSSSSSGASPVRGAPARRPGG